MDKVFMFTYTCFLSPSSILNTG